MSGTCPNSSPSVRNTALASGRWRRITRPATREGIIAFVSWLVRTPFDVNHRGGDLLPGLGMPLGSRQERGIPCACPFGDEVPMVPKWCREAPKHAVTGVIAKPAKTPLQPVTALLTLTGLHSKTPSDSVFGPSVVGSSPSGRASFRKLQPRAAAPCSTGTGARR
jgi:hypothetical protein